MMRKLTIFFVLLVIVLSGCTAPILVTEIPEIETEEEFVPAATETADLTATPTLEPTLTPTITPTITPVPTYTEFGKDTNFIANILNWDVELCGKEILEEDMVQGRFLYREDTKQYFCGFKGYTEPVTENLPQYLLGLVDILNRPGWENGVQFILSKFNTTFYENPSIWDANMLIERISNISSIEEILEHNPNSHFFLLRIWPLTEAEKNLIEPYLNLAEAP